MKKNPSALLDAAELRRRAEEQLKRQLSEADAQESMHDMQRLLHELQVHQIELEMQNEELQQSEEVKTYLAQYTDLYDFAPVGYFMLDRDGTISQVNLTGAHLLGMDRSQLVNRRFALFISEDSRPAFNAFLNQVFTDQTTATCEASLLKEGHPLFWVHLEAKTSEDGQECRAIVVDITERKKTEQLLLESQEKYKRLFDSSPELIIELDEEGNILSVNLSMATNLNASTKKLMGKNIFDILPRDIAEKRGKIARMALIEGKNRECDDERAGKHFHNIYVPIIHPDGKKTIQIIARDITGRKKAENALKESEEKYKNLFEMAPDAVMTLGMDGMITSWNTTAETLTGYSAVEMIGKYFSEFRTMKAEEAPRYLKMFDSLSEGKVPTTFETTMFHKNGEPLSVDVRVGLVTKDGEPNGLLVISRDITERKKAEEMLKNDEEKLRKIFDSSPDAITLADLQGNIIECNQLALEMYGTSIKKDMIDMNSFDFIAPEDRERAMKNLKKTLEVGVVKNVQYNFLKKDGSKYPGELSATIVNDQDGNPKYFLAIIRDISERKKADESLVEYQRKIEQQNIQLKKKDQLKTDFLNITSHELRTPMSAIKGYVQILLKQTFGQINDDQKQALDVVLRNTNRLDNLIQDILDISRLESGTMKFLIEHIEIREMVNEIVETMQPYSNQKEIKINTEIEENIPELVADKERIKQVITNIVHNAVKFSQNGSIINLRARKEQDTILFEIQDFGRGIPKDQKKRIFEMFYQVDSGADRKFGGAGLGLAISRGIVIASGGKIWVESTLGAGSTFSFNLPLKPVEDVEKRFTEMDLFGLEKRRR